MCVCVHLSLSKASKQAGNTNTSLSCALTLTFNPRQHNTQELSNVLYALARFGHTPEGGLMDDLLAALQLHFGESSPSPTTSEQSHAHHQRGEVPPSSTAAAVGSQNTQGSVPSSSSSELGVRGAGQTTHRPFNTQELSVSLWSLAQLGVQPSEAWLAGFWAAVQRQIRCVGNWSVLGRCRIQVSPDLAILDICCRSTFSPTNKPFVLPS